jgi:hypothetical protein
MFEFDRLANHGYLPRDGKKISIPMILKAASGGYYLPTSVFWTDISVHRRLQYGGGYNSHPREDRSLVRSRSHDLEFGCAEAVSPRRIDYTGLRTLCSHNLIESDASLSREDFALGDNLHFNETIFRTLANSNPGVDYYNITSAGQVQHERLAVSLATNPNITNTPKEIQARSGASAFYLSVMGDPVTGVAPKKFVSA